MKKKTGIPPKDITGQKFGMLTAISLLPRISGQPPRWLCKCDCGAATHVRGTSLRAGEIRRCKACGNAVHKIHGLYGDKDFTRSYMRDYYLKNCEQKKQYAKKWHKENPRDKETARIYANKYNKAYPDKAAAIRANRRARIKGAVGQHTASEINNLYIKQQGKCTVCRTPLGKKFHRDHIMPLALGGDNWITNIQLLCQNCNLTKHTKHPIDFMQERGFLL